MKNDTIQRKKRITTCLLALLTFCLVLTGVLLFAPIEAEAAVGDTFTVDNITYMVLSESGDEGTVTVSGSTVSEQGAVTIPNSVTNGSVTYTVTAIGASAFYGNTYVTAFELPNTLTTVGANAFNGCTGITKVEIPASVTSIGVNAFANCSALDEVRVYSKTVNVGATAFPSTVEAWYVYDGSTAETYAQNNSEGLTKIASLYDVTFNYNYGTAGSFTVKPLAVGETLRLPRDFSTIATRKGHTIVSLTCNDGNTYNNGIANVLANTVAMIEGGLTFTVNWEANTYTVTLDPNGGDYEATTVEVTFGPKVPYVSNHYPYRAGYTFNGYYKNATGPTGVQYYDSDMNPTEYGWVIDHDDTLYARWTPNSYSVTYDLDGGTHEECVDFTATYGESYTLLPDTVPTKEGYTFDHWAYSYAMDGYIVEMDDEMIGQEAPFEFDEDLTFVAVWKERSPVRFEISKGAKEQEYFLNTSYVHFGGTLYYDNGEKEYLIVYEEEIAGFSTAAIQKEPVTATVTKQGCTDTFTYTVGYDYANCAHTWVQNYAHEVQCQHCETRVLLLGNSKEYDGEPMVAELKVLNGEFDTSSLTIAYGTEDGQPPSGLGVHNALVMIGDGYIQNTLSIYSYYTAEFYFEDLNGEYVIDESMTARKQSLGYTDQMFNTPFGFVQQSYEPIPIEPDGSTVLKLYYDRAAANLTLYPNGGAFENGESVQIQVKYGTPFWDAVEGVEIPERDRLSYKFLGWTLDGILITEDDERTISLNDVELFASWQERVVTGIEIPEDKRVQWYSKLSTEKFREFEAFIRYADNSTEPITVTENMLTGFDLSVLTPLDEYCTATVNYKTFSATFTYYVRNISQIEYYVKLDEGYYESDVLDYYEGQTITLMSDDAFERAGYTFYGWSDSTNGGTYAAGEEYTLQSGDTVLDAVWKLNAPTLTSNVGDTLEFVYDGIARDVTITAEHELGNQVTYTYNWYKGNCNPILPPGAEQVWSLGDVIFEGETYAFVNVSQCYDDLYKERGLYYYIEVIAAHGENTSKYVYTLYVNIEKGDQTITLSEDEFTYSEGLTIDFADYVDGTGDGTLSYAASAQNGVTFDFANGVISNITKAGGTFTLTVTKAATDNYNSATQTFTVTLNKGTQTLSVSGSPNPPTWKQEYQVSVSGNKGALSYAIISGNATVNESGVITATGTGQIRYSVTAAATNLYEAVTVERTVTFGKAAGNLAPDYATSKPTNLTICVGKTTDNITLPTGWSFASKTTFGQVGNITVSVTFTPSDTANYNSITENIFIAVADHTGGTAASCTTAQVCTECGDVLVEALGHNYNEQVDNTVRTTAANCQECNTYWYDCSRCGQSAKNDANATDKWYTSNEAGEHNMSSDWTSENGQHFHKCTVSGCTYTDTKVNCSGGTPTCQAKAICDTCGAYYGELGEHNFTEEIADTAHLKEEASSCVSGAAYWYDCAYCDEISNSHYFTSEVVGAHSFDGDGFCTLCDSGFEEPNYNANRDMNGDGTPDGAYEITKAGHLYWLATQEDYIDRHVILLNDIVINENVLLQNGSLNEAAKDSFRHWTPIYGIDEGVIFDGNGRSIGGVYFNEYDCESGGCIFTKNYGLVKNLTVKDSYFESWLLGGIAYCNYVTLDNCHSVNNTFVSTHGVGGIVCMNEITAIIKNCTNSSRIFVISDADGVSFASAGGIVAVNMSTVQDCVNTGDINVETICDSSAELFVGGVVGLNDLYDSYEIIVADCRNEGDISVCAEKKTEGEYYEAYVGGVVGGAYGGEYDDLTNTGDIEIDISDENNVGGVVGCAEYGAMMTDSHNEGAIKLLSWSAVGGVAGGAYDARILGCYNTGDIICDDDAYVAGVVASCRDSFVENSYNTGDITVRSPQDFLAIGGIVCYCDCSVVVNCYNAGDITVEIDESLASDELEYIVSGIADVYASLFVNCYNSGSITVEEHQELILTYGVYVSESDTVTIVENCYYLYSTSTENGGRTAEQFANGEVAYLIAKDFTYGEGEFAIHVDGDIWGQLIGTDPVPTMNNVNKVYALSHCAGNATLYTNNPNKVYTLLKTDAVTATCLVPGNTDYWTCLVCGKLYSDEACTLETTLQTVNLGYAEHTFGTTWDYKATDGHAHVCTVTGCGAHDTVQAHNPNIPAATEESAQYCTVCQYQMAAQLNHTHSPATEWTSNATHHWKACGGCDEHLEEAPHSYDPNNACDTTCEVCNAVREVSHDFTGEWEKDASGHWHVCTKNGCSVTDTKQNHVSAGAATETDPEVCSICGWQIAPALGHTTHTPEAEWQKNETHHWHECTGCDDQELDKAAHNDGNNDGSCDACGYAMGTTPPPHTHSHGSAWVTDANEHWNECECGDKANKAAHNDGDNDGSCDACGYAMGTTPPPHTHSHGSAWVTDANEHWNECECGDKANKAAHVDDNGDNKCDTCDYAMPKAPSNNETEKPTDATEGEKDDSIETEAPADKGCGGCGSSAALSALAIVAVIGTAAVIKKKED